MKRKFSLTALTALCLLLVLLNGCQPDSPRAAVETLTCAQYSALSGLYPAGGTRVVLCQADYEQNVTTVQLVDVSRDAVCGSRTLEGVWDFREQSFDDGRFALCQRDDNTWLFLKPDLTEIGTLDAENVDGCFTRDASAYYYIKDHVLHRQDVATGESARVTLSPDLRLLEITDFDAQSGRLAVHFFLSPYSSLCGTAILDMASGEPVMMQKALYQTSFGSEGMLLLSFDEEKMGYSALYGGGDRFFFADAGVFQGDSAFLYAIGGSPYLMGVGTDHSTLYTLGQQVAACPLSGCGITGEMHTACYLPDAGLLVGAVYQGGGFRLYVLDPAQLSFAPVADAAAAESPLRVDDALAQGYWNTVLGAPVAADLQEARQYADRLEEVYGVRILLSSQCEQAAALCDRAISLSDTLDGGEELRGTLRMLEGLDRCLALYPEGFFAQFRNSVDEGGVCFLLVGGIESNYGVVGCAYDRYDWQYIALDVQMTYGLDNVICHEIWHATENHILSCDYTQLSIDGWDALNPEGFEYGNDPTRQDPQQPWTLYNSAEEDVYFVDSYGCVDRQEDRARIMECFMTRDDEARVLIRSPHIRQKLQMMCHAVRSVFDTDRWDTPRWERML